MAKRNAFILRMLRSRPDWTVQDLAQHAASPMDKGDTHTFWGGEGEGLLLDLWGAGLHNFGTTSSIGNDRGLASVLGSLATYGKVSVEAAQNT